MSRVDKTTKAFIAWAIFVFVLAMGLLALGVWGFIEIVNWLTTK